MLIVGSTGYVVIEGWSIFDAAYMTVVTMTTVGYEEVRPLSQAGRAFNLFVMLGGVGLMLYILTVTVQAVVEDEVLKGLFRRRRMRAKLEALKQHYILCGYGRVGREVATVFRGEEAAFVVIDTNEAAVAAAERRWHSRNLRQRDPKRDAPPRSHVKPRASNDHDPRPRDRAVTRNAVKHACHAHETACGVASKSHCSLR